MEEVDVVVLDEQESLLLLLLLPIVVIAFYLGILKFNKIKDKNTKNQMGGGQDFCCLQKLKPVRTESPKKDERERKTWMVRVLRSRS